MNEACCVVAARQYNCAMLNGRIHLEQAKGSSVVDFYIVRAHYSLTEALLNEYFFVLLCIFYLELQVVRFDKFYYQILLTDKLYCGATFE